MKGLFVVFCLLLSSCVCPEKDLVEQQIDHPSAVIPAHTNIAIDVLRENSPCDKKLWAEIHWLYSPTDELTLNTCQQPAWGCTDPWQCKSFVYIATYDPRSNTYITNVWGTALVNEIGYWYWIQCFDRLPENYIKNPDGTYTEILDEDFRIWMTMTTDEIIRRSNVGIMSR